jgi:hypothetical protein
MAELAKKVYTEENIRRLAPGYRGKPENSDPAKVEKGPTASEQPKVLALSRRRYHFQIYKLKNHLKSFQK